MTRSQKKILVIDDEGELIDVLSTRLKSEGFEVDSALDGLTGIEKVYSFKPDVILLDISMPGISGWEVCERLRADPRTKNVKIFIITGTRDLKQTKKAGADRVILKPLNFDEVLSALK